MLLKEISCFLYQGKCISTCSTCEIQHMLFCIFLLLYKEGTVSDMVDTVIEKEVCVMLFWVLFHPCFLFFFKLYLFY